MSDWTSTRLGDAVEYIKNGTTATQLKIKSPKLVTRIETIADGEVNLSKVGFVAESDNIERCRLTTGDILFSHINSIKHIGKTALIRSDDEIYNGMNLLQIRPSRARAYPSFLLEVLRSDDFRSEVRSRAKQAVNQASISIAQLQELEIFLPPLPEQKKVAEILSGIDRSIEVRRSSIQKADSIMNAMKEDLMTGSEEWEEHELGELLSFRNGLNTEKGNFGQGVPFVSYKNVYSGGIVTAKNLTQKVSLSAVEEERFSLRSGDILFTRTSETPEEIGFSCVFDDRHGSAVFNGFCIRGRPLEEGKLIPDFASFALRTESVLSQMRFLCKYTTRAGISAESLSKVKVRIPSPKTQQQLADSLIAVREYCSTQSESMRHLIDIKKSVSSDLLSGRKRVSV